MLKMLLFILGGLCSGMCYAQKEGNIWYFGQQAGLDFNTSPPVPLSDGALATSEGCSSIADPVTGQLLFYTDGILVWDRNHNVMPACVSNPLNGDPSSSQSGVIVPKPGSSTLYYIFTTPAQAGVSGHGLPAMCYSVVDLSLNGGNGDLSTINQVLIDSSTEKIAAVGNCSRSVYWVVGHRWNCDSFYAFRITAAGISAPVKSRVGIVHTDNGAGDAMGAIGYMKFSSDSRKLGVVTYIKLNTVEIFNFDFGTGIVSSFLKDSLGVNPDDDQEGPYGCSFSPDNSKFYVSYLADESKIFQYDMQAGSPPDIVNSKTVVGTMLFGRKAGALQNGPDGKMYIGVPGNNVLPVITHPNAPGMACGYTWAGQSISPGSSSYGLPVIVESFLSSTGPSFNVPFNNKVCNGDTLPAPQYNKLSFTIEPPYGVAVNADSSLVSFFPQKTTTYTVISSGECGKDTVVFTLYVSHGPTADFVFDPQAPRIEDISLTLRNKSYNASSYAWLSDGILQSADFNYTMPNPGEGNYCYTLVAMDSIGCTDSVEKCVDVVNNGISQVFLPNAFTPGNDGINDLFRVRGVNITLQSLSVFNRYGERVFTTSDIEKGWDGTYKGKPCDAGTYFYLVRYKERSGAVGLKKGDIILLR